MDPLTNGGGLRFKLRVPLVGPPWAVAGEDLAIFQVGMHRHKIFEILTFSEILPWSLGWVWVIIW